MIKKDYMCAMLADAAHEGSTLSVQVFVHVPLVRAYFLGGGHMHKLCPRSTQHDKAGKCLSCELVSKVPWPHPFFHA